MKTQAVKSATKDLENSGNGKLQSQEKQGVDNKEKHSQTAQQLLLNSVYDILRSAPAIDLTQRHKGVRIMRVGKGWPKRAKASLSECKAKDNTIGGGGV